MIGVYSIGRCRARSPDQIARSDMIRNIQELFLDKKTATKALVAPPAHLASPLDAGSRTDLLRPSSLGSRGFSLDTSRYYDILEVSQKAKKEEIKEA